MIQTNQDVAKTNVEVNMTNPFTIESLLFILFYMATQGRLHTGSLLTVTISRPSGYICGDYNLTQGTIGLTYKYPLIRAELQAYAALNDHDLVSTPVAF